MKLKRAAGVTILLGAAVILGCYLGYWHRSSLCRTMSTANPAGLFVDDSGPSPVTAQSAPSKASDALVPLDLQLDARTKTLQRPRIQTSRNSPGRVFVGEFRPWPVNAQSAPFTATGVLVSSDQRVDAKVSTLQRRPNQAP
jgi:hypothetical protein